MQLFVIVGLGYISVLYPSNESEKPLILLHILLSFTLFQLLIANAGPTSNSPPLLGLYIVSSMAIAALHVLTACLILRIHRLNGTSEPPRWICRFIVRPVLIALNLCCKVSRKLSRKASQSVDLTIGIKICISTCNLYLEIFKIL